MQETDTAESILDDIQPSEVCQAPTVSAPEETANGSNGNGRSLLPSVGSREPDGRFLPGTGGKERQYSTEEIIAALHKHRGGGYLAAKELGCCADTIWSRARAEPSVKAVMKHYRGTLVDKAEGSLRDAVDAGDAWAVQFTLRTIGKNRGYVERTETKSSVNLKGALVQFLAPAQAAGLLGLPTEALPIDTSK